MARSRELMETVDSRVLWNELCGFSTQRLRVTYVGDRAFETQQQAAAFLGVSSSHLSNALTRRQTINGHVVRRCGEKLEFRTQAAMEAARQEHSRTLPSLDRRLLRCWNDQQAVYTQTANDAGLQLNFRSCSTRGAVEIRGLIDALSHVCGRESMKRKRGERRKGNLEKRTKDVLRTMDNNALERRLLLSFHKYTVTTCDDAGKLYLYVMPDFTRADALVRVPNMPAGTYVQVQWKTTHGKRKGSYTFQNCNGYDDMVLVMMSEDDGKIWACSGREVTQKAIRPNRKLSVLSSAQLYAYLVRACASEALPTITLLEAERDVRSVNQLKEYEHIHAYVRSVYGAIDFTERRDSDANVYRLTASGHVVKYPDGQALSHDLEVFSSLQDACDGTIPLRIQFKSAHSLSKCATYQCSLSARRGIDTDGRILAENTYGAGDADVYVVCHLDDTRLQTWTFSEHVMLERGIIGTDCNPTCLMCAVPNTGVRQTSSSWTRNHYDVYMINW